VPENISANVRLLGENLSRTVEISLFASLVGEGLKICISLERAANVAIDKITDTGKMKVQTAMLVIIQRRISLNSPRAWSIDFQAEYSYVGKPG